MESNKVATAFVALPSAAIHTQSQSTFVAASQKQSPYPVSSCKPSKAAITMNAESKGQAQSQSQGREQSHEQAHEQGSEQDHLSRRQVLSSAAYASLMAAIAASASNTTSPALAAAPAPASWVKVDLGGTDTTVFDISFVPSTNKGWLVGSKGTVMESTDQGKTWQARSFQNLDADEEINYRFSCISFYQDEGWVIGKPQLLLKTRDGGKSWERVPLNPKLPGEPVLVTALGPNTAEMTTSQGAVYITTNGGRNWKAQVKETIDATLNRTVSSGVTGASYFTGSIISVLRDRSGSYLAVSSRGNFFLTWSPGQDFWIPHGRDTSRRIQSMGFIKDDLKYGLWMSTRGGGLSFTKPGIDLFQASALDFEKVDIKAGGYGILDVAFRPDSNEIWAAVGGGSLWCSTDNGKTWNKDKLMEKAGAVLYKIKFFDSKTAFALGASGVLLRYNAV